MTPVTPTKSPRIAAFGVVAIVHLVLSGTKATPWDSISKSRLTPTNETRATEDGTGFDPTIGTDCWPVLPESSAAKA